MVFNYNSSWHVHPKASQHLLKKMEPHKAPFFVYAIQL